MYGRRCTDVLDLDAEDQGAKLTNITARAGHLQGASEVAANDAQIAVALSILLLIYVWNCAIYRARLRVIAKNGLILCQPQGAAFSTPTIAEPLAIQWLHETRRLILEADTLCQMNSPLTSMTYGNSFKKIVYSQ